MKAPVQLIAFLVDAYIYSDIKRKIIKMALCDGKTACELEDEFGYCTRTIERYIKEGRDMLKERMSV